MDIFCYGYHFTMRDYKPRDAIVITTGPNKIWILTCLLRLIIGILFGLEKFRKRITMEF